MNGMVTMDVWHAFAGEFYNELCAAGIAFNYCAYAGGKAYFTFCEEDFENAHAIWDSVSKKLRIGRYAK
jgi:hypothetical protein